MNFELDLSFLRKWQKEFFANHKRRNVLVVHRRAWKTIVTIAFLMFKAMLVKGAYWYIAPYRGQAKSIAWEALIKMTAGIHKALWMEYNIAELKATFPNGSTVTLFGADNGKALRGLDLRGVVLDEYADINKELYSKVVFPMINAYKDGWTVWIGTPNGKNQFYDIYQKALLDETKYYTSYLNCYETKLLDEEQIADAIEEGTDRTWDDSAFRQEFLLDWEVASKHSFYWKQIAALNKRGGVIESLYNEDHPVYTAWDLGKNDYTVITFFQYYDNWIYIIDAYKNRNQDIKYYCDKVLSFNYEYVQHFLPHDVKVVDLATMLSRLSYFEEYLGWDKVYALNRTASVMDDVEAVRLLFKKMTFDSSLEWYLNTISEYWPKIDKEGEPTDVLKHCDVSDSFRYVVSSYWQWVETNFNYDSIEMDYWELL